MFNEYVWKTYLKAGGEKTADFFKKNLRERFTEDYAYKISEFHREYCPDAVVTEYIAADLKDLADTIAIEGCDYKSSEEKDSNENTLAIFYQGLNADGDLTDQLIFGEFVDGIAYYTTFLTIEFPALFVPYYFQCNFNVLQRIAWEFEIKLPPVPPKRDYKGRFFYYGEVCKALQEFRETHKMSLHELCAFLYDFAPKYIGGVDSYIIQDLPSPKSVFFIGGAKDDAALSEDKGSIARWQCSPDTKAGDLIVMYLRSPVSAIDSVWRSVSPGFIDPFFYYYRCTYIAKPEKLKRVAQKQLQQDAVFAELPIVKKNMQGINGVELYPSAYNHLLDIAGSDLPRLEFMTGNDMGGLNLEKDVENKLVKPFLDRLGYEEYEYQQQLYIEIGNHNHALIPDFVIHPKVSIGHQQADFLVEAKFSIPSKKLLEEAKTQARGYGKLLNAKYSVVAAKEGIWVSEARDDYTADILSYSWAELRQEDNFYTVFKVIGNGRI